jgi:ABC-type transporter MlaC component
MRLIHFKLVSATPVVFLLTLLLASFAVADVSIEKRSIQTQFEPIIQSISEQLSTHQQKFKEDPLAYRAFIDQYVRVHWDAQSTTSALIGRANFTAIDHSMQRNLVESVDTTLVRYAFEGYEYYSGQQFKLIDVAVSDSGKMGWIQVVMESPIIPDLNLDILLKRTMEDAWKVVDVRFKGITYVAVKKHQFRKILSQQGPEALVKMLVDKNNNFFSSLCDAVEQKDKQSC